MSKAYDCSKPSNNSNNNNHSNHSCSRHNHNHPLNHNPFFNHKAISPALRAFLSDMSNPALSPAILSPLLLRPLLLKSSLKSTLPLFPSNPILCFPRTLAHPPLHAPNLLCQQERDLKMKVARSKWQSLNARKSRANPPPKSKKLRKSKKLHRE